MPGLTRRRFIRNSSVLATASAFGYGCSDGGDNRHSSNKSGAIVIGSGFAGSVAALRLGLAGIPTIVLARGQQWTWQGHDTFSTIAKPDRRTTWFGNVDALTGFTPVTPWAGMIERVSGDTIDATNPAYPITLMHSPANVPANVQIQLGMSVPDELGQLMYNAATNQLTVHWPEDAATSSAVARVESFRRLLELDRWCRRWGPRKHAIH